jgi:hypothetical protein
MVHVSVEVPAHSEARLRAVMRRSTVSWLPGTWVFRDGPEAATADTLTTAIAKVADEGRVSALVPGVSDTEEVFTVFRVVLPAGVDDSGFVGWLASTIKAATGSGLFVVCGYDEQRGGIYDYYGVPQGVAGQVRHVVAALSSEPAGLAGAVLRPARASLSPVFGPHVVFCVDELGDGAVARYGGGGIRQGLLVATFAADGVSAAFHYLHVDADGSPRSGRFEGELVRDPAGRWTLSAPSVPDERDPSDDPAPLVLHQM